MISGIAQWDVTLREAISSGAARLACHEDLRSQASRDARLLLLHVIGASKTVLYTDGDRALSSASLSRYDFLISRRLAGEPIQYLLGEQEFYGLTLAVTPNVLIPRPETELLVEAVLERLAHGDVDNGPLRIVDVGTGSGAIAIAIAHNLPLAKVIAVDISPQALDVAYQNAHRHGLGERIKFLQSDLLQSLVDQPQCDAVLSNPPYIPESDRSSLHRQVRDFEPEIALFAGEQGLDIYRRLIPQAATLLKPRGLLALEIGQSQHAAVSELLYGWSEVEVLDDLQGIARVVLARKPPSKTD